ncbi:MAG TPA: hypothetical protein VM553_06325, partial [Dongiaceae bacterium]|nr:hypothetical protein [Dongiaceae bacterium]
MAHSLPVSSPTFQRLLALGISLCTGTSLWLLSIDALPFLKLFGNGFPFALGMAALAALLTLGVGQPRAIGLVGIGALAVLTAVGAGRHNVFLLQPEFLALNVGAACIMMPFCLALIENGGHRPSYERLYHHAWSCCLRLGLAGLFTGAFWLLLGLCMLLFNVLNIKLFEDLFTSKPFMFIATSLMVGYGITLLGDRDNIIRNLRTLLILLSKALLPLITLIVLAFLVTLPFTGLQPLWDTRFATLLLLTTCATLIGLLGATWGDGRSNVIYPTLIAW